MRHVLRFARYLLISAVASVLFGFSFPDVPPGIFGEHFVLFPACTTQPQHQCTLDPCASPKEHDLRLKRRRLNRWSERIVARIMEAEGRGDNLRYEADYRIARITVSLAGQGDPQPFVEASYRVLGLHPDKVWPAIIERRKALLGSRAAYDRDYDEHGNPRPEVLWGCHNLSPKKPVQSVSPEEERVRRKEKSAIELLAAAYGRVPIERSQEYKQGSLALLGWHIESVPILCPYAEGTASCDAFHWGVEEAKDILRIRYRSRGGGSVA